MSLVPIVKIHPAIFQNSIPKFPYRALGRVPKLPVSQVLRDETAQIGWIVMMPMAYPLGEEHVKQMDGLHELKLAIYSRP